MKTILLLALTFSLAHSFNSDMCSSDLKGLLYSYARAVRDWNSLVNFRQAIQETGYAVQYLGWVLIDCDPLPAGLFATAPLIEAGEQMRAYSGSDTFESLLAYTSEAPCEEKLQVILENADYVVKSNSGYDSMLQSLHDFIYTCHSGLGSF